MQKHKINLVCYNKPNKKSIYTERKKYSVHYAHQKFKTFKSKEDCLAFLKGLSNFLNDCIFELNEKQIFLYAKVRRCYVYCDVGLINSINELFASNDQLLFRALHRHSDMLGNSDKTTCLMKIASNLIGVCKLLKNSFDARNLQLYYEINNIIAQLEKLYSSIENYE